jgi:hypothetical protein
MIFETYMDINSYLFECFINKIFDYCHIYLLSEGSDQIYF